MPTAPANETVSGTVERVTFFNEETGFAIVRVRVKGHAEPVTVLGNTATVNAGEQLEATGTWSHNANFGRQFKAASLTTRAPDGCEGIARYLGSGLIEGVGPVYAEKIVQKFGAETLEVIDQASKRLEEVEGIGPKRRREIKASWERQKGVRNIMLFLHQHKVPTARAVRIYKHYGDEAIAVVTANPYQLAEDVWGIGFKTADQIAANLGIAGSDPRRLQAGVLHHLEASAADGHTALPRGTVEEAAAALLGATPEEVAGAVGELLAGDRLRTATAGGETLVALPRLVRAEAGIAARLKALAARPASYPPIDVPAALAWAEQETGTALADGQRAAVAAALSHRVAVVTGGPGVGKTTLVNTILAILGAKGVTARLAAPTGRAAKRLAESTRLEAKTLHRLLEYQPAKGFSRNAARPLDDADLFVVDEASMIDAPLMHALLQALPEPAHLLVVGDVDQLPSVGAGAVLADVIASGAVPVARLTEVFRQAATSQIVRAAHALNRGELPDLEPSEGSDFYFVERPSPEAIAATVAHLVQDRVPRRFGFDPVRDIQVLTPMHRGPAGARNLNHTLQAALNPPGEFKAEVERFGTLFRTGDKVIQTRNNYELEVYNGDIGTVVEIASEPVAVTVRFGEPSQHHLVTYKTTDLDELEPAYAITVHKSQGSEFPCVVVPVTTSHFVMLQRNLFYTAVTRGRKLVVLVGERRALATAARTPGARRSTLLGHFLASP